MMKLLSRLLGRQERVARSISINADMPPPGADADAVRRWILGLG